ncbi:hypothetical protein WJX84_007136 [Apatococcus fuscideae]|uniref:Sugar phosphate transporter domain-containing protein n=1 Tax=Apatococcus fuscideae TaxID=2026836 RepID=A0AAW1T2K4_9CHLO
MSLCLGSTGCLRAPGPSGVSRASGPLVISSFGSCSVAAQGRRNATFLGQQLSTRQFSARQLSSRSRSASKTVASASAAENPIDGSVAKVTGPEVASPLVTAGFIGMWYALNVGFNLQNKTLFNYFPFPWTVSAVHVVVGLVYCLAAYAVGAKKASFGRKVSWAEFMRLVPPASMHAIGHVAANLSFAAVAISLTHTVKTLEPVFSATLSKLLLGVNTPLPVCATLIPIMAGVSLASAAELSFSWMGFLTAMLSNLTFGFRAVLSKQLMGSIKDLDSTAVYAYTTLVSVIICVPLALIFEGGAIKQGIQTAAESHPNFWYQLTIVGLLYHLYNQFAFNTLSRVSPVSHGVCNVVKRVVIIGTSVLFFGNKLTTKTKIGTAVALLGTYLYTEASKNLDRAELKPKAALHKEGLPGRLINALLPAHFETGGRSLIA